MEAVTPNALKPDLSGSPPSLKTSLKKTEFFHDAVDFFERSLQENPNYMQSCIDRLSTFFPGTLTAKNLDKAAVPQEWEFIFSDEETRKTAYGALHFILGKRALEQGWGKDRYSLATADQAGNLFIGCSHMRTADEMGCVSAKRFLEKPEEAINKLKEDYGSKENLLRLTREFEAQISTKPTAPTAEEKGFLEIFTERAKLLIERG